MHPPARIAAAAVSNRGNGSDAGVPLDALLVPTGLIAYYPMDVLSGTTITDETGRGHDGECSADPCPTVKPGKIGGSYAFSGSRRHHDPGA